MRGKILAAVAAAALTVTAGVVAQVGGVPARLRLQSLGVGVAAPAGNGNISASGDIAADGNVSGTAGIFTTLGGNWTGSQLTLTNGAQAGFVQADGTGISLGSSSNHPLSLHTNGVIGARLLRPADGGRLDALNGFSVNGVAVPAPTDIARLSQPNTFTTAMEIGANDGTPVTAEMLRLTVDAGSPFISFFNDSTSGTRRGYLQHNSNNNLYLQNDVSGGSVNLVTTGGGAVQANDLPIATGRLASGRFTNNGSVCAVSGSDEQKNISSCTRNSAGNVTVTFSANTFDQNPVCSVAQFAEGSGQLRLFQVQGTAATTIVVSSYTTAGVATDAGFHIVCVGG